MNDIKLNYDDITIIPEEITTISSRKECNPFDENGMLPIFASCMSSVVSMNNYRDFNDNNIYTVIPRSYPLIERTRFVYYNRTPYNFVAFSLQEAEDLLSSFELNDGTAYICIDLANGHMQKLLEIAKKIKDKWHNRVVIMSGNIANPQTYKYYDEAGIDFVRCSVGSGGCCFIKGTQIIMADGTIESIEDINVGDYVNTPEGPHKVLNTFQKEVHETIKINDKIECTPNHEFFVIEKSVYNSEMTDEEILKAGKYIKASDLNNDYLLIED